VCCGFQGLSSRFGGFGFVFVLRFVDLCGGGPAFVLVFWVTGDRGLYVLALFRVFQYISSGAGRCVIGIAPLCCLWALSILSFAIGCGFFLWRPLPFGRACLFRVSGWAARVRVLISFGSGVEIFSRGFLAKLGSNRCAFVSR